MKLLFDFAYNVHCLMFSILRKKLCNCFKQTETAISRMFEVILYNHCHVKDNPNNELKCNPILSILLRII